jgi:hypothetical protein
MEREAEDRGGEWLIEHHAADLLLVAGGSWNDASSRNCPRRRCGT